MMQLYKDDIPWLALSVRQPWAGAIIYGGKDIENRTLGSIRAGRMKPGRICIHAATGMTQDEYRWGSWRLEKHGVACPLPTDLFRGAIIGHVDVTEIVTDSDSPWFGGKAGLRLKDPIAMAPIPAKGTLGYFEWEQTDSFAPTVPWMSKYESERNQPSLFEDLQLQFSSEPRKPFGS